MTDEPHDPQRDPDAETVRRLLADARHSAPMPDDVAARMDAVLDALAAEAPAPPDAAATDPVVPVVASLSAQRRRRAAGMLVAAATIVVGGMVVAQHLPSSQNGSGASASAENRAQADSGVAGGGGSSQPVDPGPGSLGPPARAAKLRDGLVVVRPQHFTADAVAARRLLDRRTPPSAFEDLSASGSLCSVPSTHGRRVAASYQRAPAVLVFHAPGSGSQVVDLYLCGSRRAIRSTTLPSP